MAIDFDKINDSPHLLDILIQMEDVLDSLDLYVFKNWFQGEVVDGPRVRRYWFDFTLRYPIDKRPEPRGALRLVKHGLRVTYSRVIVKSKQAAPVTEDETTEDPKPTHWQVKISIPRRLVSDMNAGELDFYDDEVEVEDVQDAQDSGASDETAYVDNGDMDEMPMGNDQATPDGTDENGDENAPQI